MQLFALVGGGGGGGVSPEGRINGWPRGSQPPSWQIQSGPGTGGMQLIALAGGGVGACPPAGSRLADDITASRNDREYKPTRRMIHL